MSDLSDIYGKDYKRAVVNTDGTEDKTLFKTLSNEINSLKIENKKLTKELSNTKDTVRNILDELRRLKKNKSTY
jgi:septal ring factor EnvC (AmiA/AmiB activator)